MKRKRAKQTFFAHAKKVAVEVDTWPDWKKAGFLRKDYTEPETTRRFTSGPWTAEYHGRSVALYSGRSQELHGLRLMNLDDGDSNFRANVRLICAAPDLVKALENLVACIDETRGPNADAALHQAKTLLEKLR